MIPIHRQQEASANVAAHLGLEPTDASRDGEVLCTS